MITSTNLLRARPAHHVTEFPYSSGEAAANVRLAPKCKRADVAAAQAFFLYQANGKSSGAFVGDIAGTSICLAWRND